MKIHDCQQCTKAWAELHVGIPTVGMMDQLLTPEFELRKGEMPKSIVYKKVAEKLLGHALIDLDRSSFMMEQGLILEEECRPWFELEYEKKVLQVGFITSDDGRIGCSPDGLIEGEDCGLEIKCPSAAVQVKYLVNGVLPKEYVAQVYASMFVTGFKKWIFVSYRRGFPALVLEIHQNEKAISMIRAAINQFHGDFERAMDRISNITKLRDLEAA